MSKYWSDFVHTLVPYVPGEQPKIANLVKLNTNENPYPPSPKAVAAMQRVLADNGDELRLYPDPNSDRLKEAIARFYHVKKDNVFVGNGSDEVLAHAFFGLLKHDKPVLFPDITYSFYPVYCGLYEVPFKTIPLTEKFDIDLRQYEQANGGIIFPNPNAPTGVLVSLTALERLLQKNTDSVVVVDEAYIDFGGESAIPLVKKYTNLLVTQTVSKSRSLAGLRVGLAIGHPDLIEALERIKNSFNSYPLGRMAIAGAAAAFDDTGYFYATCAKVIAHRTALVDELNALGFEVLPSAANFIFARHPQQDAAKLMQQLRERSVLVRYFKLPRINQYLRITIGAPEQNAALIKALNEIL
jgi:histidinol-phosphate aminotransferase